MADGNVFTKEHIIGKIKFEKPSLKMVKSSVFCAPRGFFVFIIAFFCFIDSLISKGKKGKKSILEKRKREALYGMFHNIAPFLEVVLVLIPIMCFMHFYVAKRFNLSSTAVNLITALICIMFAFTICMSLRMLGIRKDCCNDINFEKGIFNENGDFRWISFSVPERNEGVPDYFRVDVSKEEKDVNCNDEPTRRPGQKIFFKVIYCVLHIPIVLIQFIDVIFRTIFDLISYPFKKCFEKYKNTLNISEEEKNKNVLGSVLLEDTLELLKNFLFSINMIIVSFPFCEQRVGLYVNDVLCEKKEVRTKFSVECTEGVKEKRGCSCEK